MKEGQDVVHRAATPSTFPYLMSGRTGKNTTARVFSGSHSSLEMVGANAMRDRWPPADMTTSYTARSQDVATRQPWLSYTGAWNNALGDSSLELIAPRYAVCRTIFCPPFLSGQRKRLVSLCFDFCAHAIAWFWFMLLRVHSTVLGWKVLPPASLLVKQQKLQLNFLCCQRICHRLKCSTDTTFFPIAILFLKRYVPLSLQSTRQLC